MGNVSYLSPTKNNKDFNIDFIYGFLFTEFKDYKFITSKKHNSLQVRYNDLLVCDMYFNQQCALLGDEYDESDMKHLIEIGKPSMYHELIKFKNSGYDRFNMIEMTHGIGLHDERRVIEIYLHKFFGLYIFDDGIHPEFMSPDYVWKTKKEINNFWKKMFRV